jgi:hypothetical protein
MIEEYEGFAVFFRIPFDPKIAYGPVAHITGVIRRVKLWTAAV